MGEDRIRWDKQGRKRLSMNKSANWIRSSRRSSSSSRSPKSIACPLIETPNKSRKAERNMSWDNSERAYS